MRTILYFAIGLFVLLLAGWLGGRYYVGQRLDRLVDEANAAGAELTMADRSVSFRGWAVGVTADSVRLRQRVGGRWLSGSVGRVTIEGVSVASVLRGEVSVDDVLLANADLSLHPAADTTNASPAGGSGSGPRSLSVRRARLRNGRVSVFAADESLTARATGLAATLALHFPLAPASAPPGRVAVDSIFLPSADGGDRVFNGLVVDTKAGSLDLDRFRIVPDRTIAGKLMNLRYKNPWEALDVRGVRVPTLPLDSLLAGGWASVPAVDVDELTFATYERLALEPEPGGRRKPFPVEAFRAIGRPLRVERMTVANTSITYGILEDDGTTPHITFAGRTELGNFSTRRQPESAYATADFTFAGAAPLTARFELGQAGNGRDFRATAELGRFDLTNLVPLLRAAAGLEVEGGRVNSLEHDFSSDGTDVTAGELILQYEKLEAKLHGKGSGLFNLVEDLVIRDSNPRPDGDLVRGRVSFEHDPTRSFFNLYWKSVLAGMKESVMAGVVK